MLNLYALYLLGVEAELGLHNVRDLPAFYHFGKAKYGGHMLRNAKYPPIIKMPE